MKTKILTFYTDTHIPFLELFMKTLAEVDRGNLDVIARKYAQECPTGEFASDGWNQCMHRKIEFILHYMKSMDEGEKFIFSDADVQFFRSPAPYIDKVLDGQDIAFQNDYYGHACAGFFYARNNRKVEDFFYEVLDNIKDNRDDQDTINKLLPQKKVDYALLPPQFFTWGSFYNHWHGETEFPLPEHLIMHHGNWVMGVDKKMELMQTVREVYERQCKQSTSKT